MLQLMAKFTLHSFSIFIPLCISKLHKRNNKQSFAISREQLEANFSILGKSNSADSLFQYLPHRQYLEILKLFSNSLPQKININYSNSFILTKKNIDLKMIFTHVWCIKRKKKYDMSINFHESHFLNRKHIFFKPEY